MCILISFQQDGDLGGDDEDEDGPREADPEGRVEKYIGVKVKASVFLACCIFYVFVCARMFEDLLY